MVVRVPPWLHLANWVWHIRNGVWQTLLARRRLKKVNFSQGTKKTSFWREFPPRITRKKGGQKRKGEGMKTSTIVCSYRNSFSFWMKNARSLPYQVNENETCHHVRLKHVLGKFTLSFLPFRYFGKQNQSAAGSSGTGSNVGAEIASIVGETLKARDDWIFQSCKKKKKSLTNSRSAVSASRFMGVPRKLTLSIGGSNVCMLQEEIWECTVALSLRSALQMGKVWHYGFSISSNLLMRYHWDLSWPKNEQKQSTKRSRSFPSVGGPYLQPRYSCSFIHRFASKAFEEIGLASWMIQRA